MWFDGLYILHVFQFEYDEWIVYNIQNEITKKPNSGFENSWNGIETKLLHSILRRMKCWKLSKREKRNSKIMKYEIQTVMYIGNCMNKDKLYSFKVYLHVHDNISYTEELSV